MKQPSGTTSSPKLKELKHDERAVKKVETKHDDKALQKALRKVNRVVKEIVRESRPQ